MVLDSAGGKDAIAGDYLYRSRPALGFRYGMWGAFRVAEKGKDAVSITANTFNPQKTLIGFNTVNRKQDYSRCRCRSYRMVLLAALPVQEVARRLRYRWIK